MNYLYSKFHISPLNDSLVTAITPKLNIDFYALLVYIIQKIYLDQGYISYEDLLRDKFSGSYCSMHVVALA
jgi:hypothetical protein